VAVASTVADAIAIAILRTWLSHALLPNRVHRQATLIHTHLIHAAFGSIGRKAGIGGLQTQIHQGSATSDNLAIVTYIGMG